MLVSMQCLLSSKSMVSKYANFVFMSMLHDYDLSVLDQTNSNLNKLVLNFTFYSSLYSTLP